MGCESGSDCVSNGRMRWCRISDAACHSSNGYRTVAGTKPHSCSCTDHCAAAHCHSSTGPKTRRCTAPYTDNHADSCSPDTHACATDPLTYVLCAKAYAAASNYSGAFDAWHIFGGSTNTCAGDLPGHP